MEERLAVRGEAGAVVTAEVDAAVGGTGRDRGLLWDISPVPVVVVGGEGSDTDIGRAGCGVLASIALRLLEFPARKATHG